MKKMILFSTLLLACVATAQAQVVLQPVKDNPMTSGAGHDVTNKGWGGLAYMGVNETTLMQFDFSGVALAANEYVQAATLQLFSGHEGGYKYNWQVKVYAMRSAWQEGMGVPVDGFGGTSYPWGPVSIGDAVYAYRQVTAVGLGSGPFATQTVATAGIPWEAPGAMGATQDRFPEAMIDENAYGPQAFYPPGTSLAILNFTADGLSVLNRWIKGTQPNNGWVLSMQELGTGSNWRIATREFGETLTSTPSVFAPTLTLTIGTAAPVVGDATGDRHVNALDLQMLAGSWAKSVGQSGYDARCEFSGDSRIDVTDLLLMAGNWGQ